MIAPGTAALVIDGVIAVSSYRPDVRGTIVLRAGEGTAVAPDRPPSPPSRWGAAPRRRGRHAAAVSPFLIS